MKTKLEQELAIVDSEIEAMPMALAIAFMLGARPAGGPYELVIGDDSRWKTNNEYRLRVKLIEHPDQFDEFEERTEPDVVYDGLVYPKDIYRWIELNDRRWSIVKRLNEDAPQNTEEAVENIA